MIQINYEKGFTLIELIVVMAILAVLSVAGFSSFTSSQQKGRDAKRKSDLNNVTKTLEMYYNDRGRYPSSSTGRIVACGDSCAAACTWGATDTSICMIKGMTGTAVNYMQTIPKDPSSNQSYYYTSDAQGSYYVLYAHLENPNDPAIITDTSNADCSTLTGVQVCNFGVSSTNVVPGAAPEPTRSGPSSTPVPPAPTQPPAVATATSAPVPTATLAPTATPAGCVTCGASPCCPPNVCASGRFCLVPTGNPQQ